MSVASKYILFVDDDQDDCEILRECCEQLGVLVQARFVFSGEGVFRLLSSVRDPKEYPSLIVLDVNLPGMGGADILLRLKRHSRYRHIPVVVHTTASYEPSQYTTMGADAFYAKGYSYEQWKGNVASFFHRVSSSPGALFV